MRERRTKGKQEGGRKEKQDGRNQSMREGSKCRGGGGGGAGGWSLTSCGGGVMDEWRI